MLHITFGRFNVREQDKMVENPNIEFKHKKKPEWFETDFVKRVLKGIDKCEVLFEEALKDRYGHGISTLCISTGSKTLCCIYFDEENKVYSGSMGDNCVPYLLEIARQKEVYIFLEHYMDFDSEEPFQEGLIEADGVLLKTEFEYDCAYSEYSAKREEETKAMLDAWEEEDEKNK